MTSFISISGLIHTTFKNKVIQSIMRKKTNSWPADPDANEDPQVGATLFFTSSCLCIYKGCHLWGHLLSPASCPPLPPGCPPCSLVSVTPTESRIFLEASFSGSEVRVSDNSHNQVLIGSSRPSKQEASCFFPQALQHELSTVHQDTFNCVSRQHY